MSLYYMPESVSHPSNSLRVGLGTLRPLKAWKTDRGGCLGREVQSMGLRDMYSAGDIIEDASRWYEENKALYRG